MKLSRAALGVVLLAGSSGLVFAASDKMTDIALLCPFCVALAGVPAMTHPVLADPLAATASDHAQAVAAAIEQPASPAPAWSSSSDATAPAAAASAGRLGKNIATAGFGWG